jgi:poly(3-hydroxybutyrate) depolymerase
VLYQLYQSQSDLMYPARVMAQATQALFGWPHRGALTGFGRHLSATLEVLDSLQVTHERPDYGISEVVSGGETVRVHEAVAGSMPFGTLLHFVKDMAEPGPRVLVVAPLSGHFSTLLRYTVRTLLKDHDVYITDWHNARDVPVRDGVFGFSDYVDTVIAFLTQVGPGAHVVAVCQPCVQVLERFPVCKNREDSQGGVKSRV